MSMSEVDDIHSSFKVYFSTVVRSAPQQQGGEIVLVDWVASWLIQKLSRVGAAFYCFSL